MQEHVADQLEKIAKDLLSEDGKEIVRDFLMNDEQHLAKIALLAALDRRVTEGRISDATAAVYYKILNVPKNIASRIRQNNMPPPRTH